MTDFFLYPTMTRKERSDTIRYDATRYGTIRYHLNLIRSELTVVFVPDLLDRAHGRGGRAVRGAA